MIIKVRIEIKDNGDVSIGDSYTHANGMYQRDMRRIVGLREAFIFRRDRLRKENPDLEIPRGATLGSSWEQELEFDDRFYRILGKYNEGFDYIERLEHFDDVSEIWIDGTRGYFQVCREDFIDFQDQLY